MRCPKCGGYSFDEEDRCTNCGYKEKPQKSPRWWNSEDFQNSKFESINKNKDKELSRSASDESSDGIQQLPQCPYCMARSLFWTQSVLMYECLNPHCKHWVTQLEFEGVRLLRISVQHEFEFTNPLLLTVKMFLADVRSWRREYIEREYVCADFAKEVYEAATEREIRCGYATIYFENSYIAHAIVCFETDYGLQFFEPQSGEEVIVKIRKPYPVVMEGVPRNAIVRGIEIKWNDGTTSVID